MTGEQELKVLMGVQDLIGVTKNILTRVEIMEEKIKMLEEKGEEDDSVRSKKSI